MLNKFLFIIAFMLLLFISPLANAQAVVVDELIATVNGDVITKSDLVWALALNPKVNSKNEFLANLSTTLEQTIDQRLLLSEANRLPSLDPSPREISQAIAEVIKKFPSELAFYQRLSDVGLTGEMLQKIFRDRLLILKYVDFRFRSFALITENEIQLYYEEKVKPKLEAQQVTAPEKPSDEERKLIEAILVEERVNSQIDQFLEVTRQQADIVRLISF